MLSGIDEFYGSKFLKATDLAKGQKVKVRIARIEKMQFDGDKRPKLMLHFAGDHKPLVLNKTNAESIAESLGRDHTQWPGSAILLYRTRTDMNGKLVDCVRVDMPDGGLSSEEEAELNTPGPKPQLKFASGAEDRENDSPE